MNKLDMKEKWTESITQLRRMVLLYSHTISNNADKEANAAGKDNPCINLENVYAHQIKR